MITVEVEVGLTYGEEDIKNALADTLPVTAREIGEVEILKKSLLVGERAGYKLKVGAHFSPEREAGLLKMKKKVKPYPDFTFEIPEAFFRTRPVVIGAGPAGLFSALILAMAGGRPIILERGVKVEDRLSAVSDFFSGGELNEENNVQFGEGGAGTFSDGKLKVGSQDKYKRKILEEFVLAGAPEEIKYLVGAHLGTDKLPLIVKNIREKIISLGGEFLFETRATDLEIKFDRIVSVSASCKGKTFKIPAETVILATGHSARDTFEMLLSKGIAMEAKGFGLGVRIEHKQSLINKLIYKDENIANSAGSASYRLVTHLPSGRSVYSFCMCPGGEVVAAASERDGIVTNGMSNFKRNGENANAALLVSLTPADFGHAGVLGGIYFQREIERQAYSLFGGYTAPALKLSDFLKRRESALEGEVRATYARGVAPASPDKYLPSDIADSLRAGILDFDNWLSGYADGEALLVGPETRSTSPVRILRGEDYHCIGISGLYPIGEGAGYAGGIISSAYDGVRCAEAIIEKERASN